jgi:hypothetical protein
LIPITTYICIHEKCRTLHRLEASLLPRSIQLSLLSRKRIRNLPNDDLVFVVKAKIVHVTCSPPGALKTPINSSEFQLNPTPVEHDATPKRYSHPLCLRRLTLHQNE